MPGADFEILIEDEGHFAAHANDLYLSRQEVMNIITKELFGRPREGDVRAVIEHSQPVGLTGIETLSIHEEQSFWGYRQGRSIPSHLIYGQKQPTRRLAFWGYWKDPASFVLTTFYPGEIAPREPHDPKISLEELKESMLFWALHAIVIDPE
jgi:hypothetical protein